MGLLKIWQLAHGCAIINKGDKHGIYIFQELCNLNRTNINGTSHRGIMKALIDKAVFGTLIAIPVITFVYLLKMTPAMKQGIMILAQ